MLNIQLIKTPGVGSLRSFERILNKRLISFDNHEISTLPTWSKNKDDLDRSWVSEYAQAIYKQYQEKTDGIIVFIEPEEWEARGLRGRHYVTAYAGYRFAFVKHDRKYARTANHELMHMLNDLVFITLGIQLAAIVGVTDWDEDVVHGRSPRFTRYEHDAAYDMVYEYVKKAAEKRRRVWMMGVLEKLAIVIRSISIQLSKRDHVVIEDPEPSRADKLYDVSLEAVGTDASPSDLAPDELGCAETVSELIKKVLPGFRIITGTWTLWDILRKHPEMMLVTDPQPGDIIISPTGTSSKGSRAPFPGHAGIVGKRGKIYSNDSYSGTFEQNFHRSGWSSRYKDRGGYSIYYFRIK